MKEEVLSFNREFFPSLTERARTPRDVQPLQSFSGNVGDSDLELVFEGGVQSRLALGSFNHGAALLLRLGEGTLVPLQSESTPKDWIPVADAEKCWKSQWGQYNLSIDEEHGLEIYHKNRSLMRSITNELSVGDVKQGFGFSLHKGGVQLSFEISYDEFFYGGGEDFSGMVRNGSSLELLNRDALGVGGEHQYQSTPVFYSTKGYILAQLSIAPARWDFGQFRRDVLTITSVCEHLALLVIPCDSPEHGVRLYRQLLRPAASVPKWSHGLWLSRCFYQDQSEVEGVLKGADKHGIDIDVLNLDARAWMKAETRTDFVWDLSRFEDHKTYIPKMLDAGIKLCLWESPYVSSVSDLFREGDEKGYFAKTSGGETYLLDWIPDGLDGFPKAPLAGLVDFTNPDACLWWQSLHRPYLKAGVRVFKTDFGEEIPPEAHFFDGSLGYELRNRYADLYNLTVTEVIQEETENDGIVWARSGHLEMASVPVKWAGDSQTTWRALRASLRAGLNQCVGGAIFWSHDVGGFYGKEPEPELYLRWAQLAMWGSHIRLHGTSPREPWEFGEEVLEVFKESLAVRRYLMDWIYNVGLESVKQGRSFITPLWYQYPQDRVTWKIDDQFLVGSQVLVAPILDSESQARSVYLPEGHWLDLRNGKVRTGGGYITEPRARHIPAFYLMGSGDGQLFRKVPEIFKQENT